VTDAELALSRDGKILGLRVKTVANLGAYLSTFAPAVPTFPLRHAAERCLYDRGHSVDVTGVFTNTTAVDAYRGAGRPEACYVLERMVEAGARALQMDVTEIRKKNFIPKFAGAFQTLVAVTYDSGNYGAALDKLLQIFDYKKFRTEQAAARTQGRLLGSGSRPTSRRARSLRRRSWARWGRAGLYESGKVRVHPCDAAPCRRCTCTGGPAPCLTRRARLLPQRAHRLRRRIEHASM